VGIMHSKKKEKLKRYAVLIVCAVILIGIVVLVWQGLLVNIELKADTILQNKAVGIMNASVNEAIKESGGMKDFLRIEKDTQGHITLVSADSQTLNEISILAVTKAKEKLSNIENISMEIPLGDILFSSLFAGMGPKIKIGAAPVGEIFSDYKCEFSDAGINQTKFSIFIVQEAELRMRIGFSSYILKAKTEVPVCETIVVGTVPQTYATLPSTGDFLNLVPTG
jgi:sporulation protein YunB